GVLATAPDLGGDTPDLGGETPDLGGDTPDFGGDTPDFGFAGATFKSSADNSNGEVVGAVGAGGFVRSFVPGFSAAACCRLRISASRSISSVNNESTSPPSLPAWAILLI